MPEAAMKPDQERVKNLLTDTVTLLCKNGLTFSNKLRIEGLLGVSIDDKDVFFVHISENFHQNPPEPLPEEESAESPVFTAPESPAKNSRRSRQSPSPSQTSSPATLVKPEPEDDPDELLIVEEPKPELFDRSRMVAGQRRAQRRERSPSQGGQQHGWEESGEPPIKRHLSSEEDENGGGGYVDQGSWPDLSGVGGDFDQSQVYQQDPGGAGFDTTTPGCSTWPTTLATQHQTQDSVGGHMKQVPENHLNSLPVKRALAENLVEPLLKHYRRWRFLAFRLMWNSKQTLEANDIWNNIAFYQQQMCSQLTQVQGVVFFLSAITATRTYIYSKRIIHPGVAFWVATDQAADSDLNIYNTTRNNIFSAELKLITTKSTGTEVDRQINTVAMALKDFGPGYVESKVNASSLPDNHYLKERIYVRTDPKQTTLQQQAIIMNAQQILSPLGLQLHVEPF